MPLFRKKKKKKVEQPWVEPQETVTEQITENKQENIEEKPSGDPPGRRGINVKMSKPRFLKMPSFSLSGGKIRIPGLRLIKRLLCVILFLVNTTCFFAAAPIEQEISIFFLLNGFILLDYLWKTRKIKIDQQWG